MSSAHDAGDKIGGGCAVAAFVLSAFAVGIIIVTVGGFALRFGWDLAGALLQ